MPGKVALTIAVALILRLEVNVVTASPDALVTALEGFTDDGYVEFESISENEMVWPEIPTPVLSVNLAVIVAW